MRPKKRILLVDDDEQNLSVLTFVLGNVGTFKIFPTSNPQEAIVIFAEDSIEIAIIDAAMPKMMGDDLAAKLKQIASHVPVIILGDPKKDAMKFGDALLDKKTISTAELIERIKIMSARKRGPRRGTASGHQTTQPSSLTACLV